MEVKLKIIKKLQRNQLQVKIGKIWKVIKIMKMCIMYLITITVIIKTIVKIIAMFLNQRYTNTDLKISLYVCVHIKTII